MDFLRQWGTAGFTINRTACDGNVKLRTTVYIDNYLDDVMVLMGMGFRVINQDFVEVFAYPLPVMNYSTRHKGYNTPFMIEADFKGLDIGILELSPVVDMRMYSSEWTLSFGAFLTFKYDK
jgi:hypothetical protein